MGAGIQYLGWSLVFVVGWRHVIILIYHQRRCVILHQVSEKCMFNDWDVNSDWTRWKVRIKEGTHSYGEVMQKAGHKNAPCLVWQNPTFLIISSSCLEKKDPLSDILESGNEKDSRLTRICKLHQRFLCIQFYLAKTCYGKISDRDRLWFWLMWSGAMQTNLQPSIIIFMFC